jgi:hypothetical protein
MGIAHTITKERLAAPLRERLGGKRTFFGYLVSCPYCVSHWLAFVLVPLTGAYYVEVVVPGAVGKLLSWFLSSILVAVIAAFLRVGFYFVDESKELVRQEKVVKKTEEAKLKRPNGDDDLISGRHPSGGLADGEPAEADSERSPAAAAEAPRSEAR